MNEPSRAEIWVRFAAAGLSAQGDITYESVARDADRILDEFDKRFELHTAGSDEYWIERPRA